MRTILKVLLLAVIAVNPAFSHDLQYEVSDSRTVVVEFHFSNIMPFSYEGYEIFAPGKDVPFQTGRSDELGRISFLPNSPGMWRVKIFSESGHGLDFKLDIGKDRVLKGSEKPLYEKYLKIFTGIGFILGIFGIISMYINRRKKQ